MPSPRKRRSWSYTRGFMPYLQLPPWQEDRLPFVTATAIAQDVHTFHLGRCRLRRGAGGWVVLVDGCPLAKPGERLRLATLGEAQPLILEVMRRALRSERGRTPPSPAAEQQIREALTDVLAERAEEVERKAQDVVRRLSEQPPTRETVADALRRLEQLEEER